MRAFRIAASLTNIRAAGAVALAALALPAAALADTGGQPDKDPSLIASLKRPAVLDGKRYSAKQMKRFDGQRLLFVLGGREEARGAVAAFHTKAQMRKYLRKTGRPLPSTNDNKATAAWNARESVFYNHPFLEGESITVAAGNGIGNLADHCMRPWPWWCLASWDNQISSVKTGASGAYLYYHPWFQQWTDDDWPDDVVYLPGGDSIEVWRYFNDVASSIWVPW
jgi:hypothetical protein